MSDPYTGADNLEVMLEAFNYNNYLKALVSRFAGDPASALDFGAGIGTFTDALTLPPRQITCLEPDADAQQVLAGKGYRVCSSLQELDDQRFDYIFSLNVLEHIENDEDAIRQLFRLLAPGQKLFVYVPAFDHLRTSMDDLVGHHRRYSLGSLRALLEQAGFKVEQAAYTDFLGYFATLLFRMMDALRREPDGRINKPLLIIYDRLVFPVSRLLSVPFSRLIGKNVYAVARKPSI